MRLYLQLATYLVIGTSVFVSCVPAMAQVTIERVYPGLSFEAPVDIQFADDGSNRLFVVDREGLIQVFRKDAATESANVFLDIRERVHASVEEGLLGLAFHPQYAENGRFFVYYTTTNPRRSILSAFQVTTEDPDEADSASEVVLLEIEQPHPQHNAGQLRFGPDGFLYISTGDGGGFGEEKGTGENLETLLGSILRIDVDHQSERLKYAIPPSNPFAENKSGYREEIYAYGFRNPWRFSFDRNDFETPDPSSEARLWVGDVGSGVAEEINIVEKGKNYGWNEMEGFQCHPSLADCETTGRTLPVLQYFHDIGRAIIGGFVYRGSKIRSLDGSYVYGDYVSGRIWALTYENGEILRNDELLQADSLRIYAFGEDVDGELLIAAVGTNGGGLYALTHGPISPSVEDEAVSRVVLQAENYPNPFRKNTFIAYTILRPAEIELSIYNGLGQKVRTLVKAMRAPGTDGIDWDGTDDAGRPVPPGVYLYRLRADGALSSAGQMVLVR